MVLLQMKRFSYLPEVQSSDQMTLDPSRFVRGDSLDWTEYVALVVSIVATIGLSVWTYRTTKHSDYFGSRVPYAALIISMIASTSSGVSLLGKPAEAYEYGCQFYVLQLVTFLSTTIVATELLLPTLHQLECESLYEYFELRFHKGVRMLVTAVFTITKGCYTSVMVLPPVIALNQLSGVDINVGIASLTLITVFYTMIGGFKGVIWTDTLQGSIMFASMLIFGIVSIYETGNFVGFFRVIKENERIYVPVPTLDPTDRLSFWAYSSFLYSIATLCVNQPYYQRIKCIPKLRNVKKSMWLQTLGMLFFGSFSMLIGLSIYAYYFGCDPKEAKIVDSYSQLVVFWVNSVGSRMRGLRGVYLAGIVCASISSISSNLNSIACLLETEFRFLQKTPSKRLYYQRAFTAFVGVAVTVIALTMKDSPSLIELSYLSLSSDGIIAGLFILGILVVPAEARGALAGGFITLFLLICLSILRIMSPKVKVSHVNEFMRTDQCPFNITHTGLKEILLDQPSKSSDVLYVLRLSPFSIGPFACLLTIAIGLLVSLIWPAKNRNLYNPILYSKFVHRFLPPQSSTQTGLLLKYGHTELGSENIPRER